MEKKKLEKTKLAKFDAREESINTHFQIHVADHFIQAFIEH